MPKQELIARAIIAQNDCLLVNQGTHSSSNQLYYALPGGHVEADETCIEALRRELLEELTIECSVGDLCFVIEHIYAGRHENDSTRHELTLYFTASLNTEIPQEIESPESAKNFRWLPIDSLRNAPLLPELSREYLQKYFSSQQESLYGFQNSTSTNID